MCDSSGVIAQLVERLNGIEEVWGSNPHGSIFTSGMDQKRYSTGTKGRLMKHADECREIIQRHSPNAALALEFIEFLDPGAEDRVWQRFEKPIDVLPTLEGWLDGEDPAPAKPEPSSGVSSLRAKLPSPADLRISSALHRTRSWLEENTTRREMEKMSAIEAAEATLKRLAFELQA